MIFDRGRGHDRGHDIGYVRQVATRDPDVPARTPEQAAEANVEQVCAEVTAVGKQVNQTIERCSSLAEWKELKPQLDEKIEGLKKRLQRKGLQADAQKTAKAAADYAQAQETLVAIEKKLAGERSLRPVPAVAGELEIEPKVLARVADMDQIFAWAAELSARDRDALARRLASASSEDVFAKELHNYLATARLFLEFKNVLADPKALRRDVRERVRAKRAADAAASATANTDRDGSSATEDSPVEIAERGVADASEPLPHAQTLQPLFGRHDLSRIKVQVGGPAADAARALGAEAYAIGDRVGFATHPDLHTAAHEAVHVVEGDAGVARKAELDSGQQDPREQRADALADAAVRGEHIEAQLDRATSLPAPMAAVHRKREGESSIARPPSALSRYLYIHEADLRGELVAYLREHGWPDPAQDVRFAPGGERRFTASLLGAVVPMLTDSEALCRLVSPGDVNERFHKYVDLQKPAYSPQFGIALAQLVQWAARDALAERVGPRYRALWASRFEPPEADELGGTHPMDALVARALTAEGVVDLSEMPAAQPATPTPATTPQAPQPQGERARSGRNANKKRATERTPPAAPTVEQLMAIEREIGPRLDAIRDRVAPFGFAGELREAYDARAERVALLADADPATCARYLPILQFQHTQLLTISAPLGEVVSHYWPLRGIPDFALSEERRADRKELEQLIAIYVRAAATSHDKATSTAILNQIEAHARQKQRDQYDAAEIAAETATRDVVANTPYAAPTGTKEGLAIVGEQRQAMLDGTPKGRSKYEQRKAMTLAGEVALRAHMQSAEHALSQLRSAAIAVYGDEEGLSRAFPQLKPLPLVIQDVKDRLADVDRAWNRAITEHAPVVQEDPNAPDGWADWQARAAALPIAQQAFSRIAGDQDLNSFIKEATKEIKHQAIVNAIVQLAAALLITVATGMGAAALGARAASALATEGSSLAMRGLALGADLAINVSINTAVQLAMSPPERRRTVNADGSVSEESDLAIVGFALLENALMDGAMRLLTRPLTKMQKLAEKEAEELSALPHLTNEEREALASLSFAGAQIPVELLGGMTTQWTAHRLVETFRQNGEEISEPFAMTVLQQGAAIGLGRFFHGQYAAWKQHRDALARTKIGKLPDAKALFAAREAFYARAKELSESLSPDPAAMHELIAQNEALLRQERALVESHATSDAASMKPAHEPAPATAHEPTTTKPVVESMQTTAHADAARAHHQTSHAVRAKAHDAATQTEPNAPAAAKDAESAHRGERIAAEADARYVGDGRFEVNGVTVEIRRTSGAAKTRVEGEHAIVEVPRGLSGERFEHAVATGLAEVRARTAAGVQEVTAAAVPGSSYKGKADHPVGEAELLGEANAALADVALAQPGVAGKVEQAHFDPKANDDAKEIAANTHVVHMADGTRITIRVSVAPLEHQIVAKSVLNLTKQGVTKVDDPRGHVRVEHVKGRYVIQLSNKMDPVHVRRAVAHEVAEILARRDLHLAGKLPGRDVFAHDGDVNAPLSPHDRGRLAEIVELAKDIRSHDPAAQERGRHELMALVEDMGLRAGTKDADARFERVEAELPKAAREELAKARVRDSELPEAERKKLEWTREEAEADRQAQAEYEEAHRPAFEMPSTGKKGKVTEAERKALATKARVAREQRSQQTASEIRKQNAAGVHPKMKIQIGGNAALAARDPSALLVDANRRWALDRSDFLAQTAQQLEPIKAAGLGDPYEFADAGERMPMEAIHFWQDSIAAQGPLVDGHAELGLAPDGKTLVATIYPNDGSPPLVVEVDGVPVVATGFTHENAPGARGPSPRQAIGAVDKALAKLESDPEVGAMAKDARAKLASLHGQSEADAIKALDALPDRLRGKLAGQKELSSALGVLEATKGFAELRAKDPGHVFYGDEANQLSDEQIAAMKKVVIAGGGGTGISAAEIILRRNSHAHVTMIGKDPPAGLAENDQFRAVVANHGSKELCAELHVEPGRVDGRFEFHDGYYLGAPKLVDGKYDVSAKPVNGKAPLADEHARGDTYISALGRFNDIPPPVASLVNSAERAGREVRFEALVDDDGFYIGYRISIEQPDKSVVDIDVTGAASRYVDEEMLSKGDQKIVRNSRKHDAPPESGNFDGGYASSARQGARYSARRRMRGY